MGVVDNTTYIVWLKCCNTNNCNTLEALSNSNGLKFNFALIALNILLVLYFFNNLRFKIS